MAKCDSHAQVLGENHGGKGDATGFPYSHPYPGEEETEEFRVANSKVFLNTSILGYGQSELDEGGGSRPDQNTCQKPHGEGDAGRCYMIAHLGRGGEDARADLKAEDKSDAIGEGQ